MVESGLDFMEEECDDNKAEEYKRHERRTNHISISTRNYVYSKTV